MVEVFAVRQVGESGSLAFPEPGEVRDSIRLAHADGVPAAFPVWRTVLRDPSGARLWGHRQVMALPASLIVTDCRAALASSAAAADVAGRMWVAHVRFGWLDEVAFCEQAMRLRFTHPCGLHMELTMQLGAPATSVTAATEVARRAMKHDAGRFASRAQVGRWRPLITSIACAP